MQNKPEKCSSTGILTYNQEHHCLSLSDSILLHSNDSLAVEMLGHWIAGCLQRDAGGWYLLTPYQTGIRLHPGLTASVPTKSGCHN